MNTSTLYAQDRVRAGRKAEDEVADALARNGLWVLPASDYDDKGRKIDRWLVNPDGTMTAVQIKVRETGKDLLFEVFHRWNGWDNPNNKTGRDMEGDSTAYAVLVGNTIVLAEVEQAKKIIETMLFAARTAGWTKDHGPDSKTFVYNKPKGAATLKVQLDPQDRRTKMVAYIPADVLQTQTYRI